MCIAKLSNKSVDNQNHHETACIYWGKIIAFKKLNKLTIEYCVEIMFPGQLT